MEILVTCPACKGSGEIIARIQYTDRRKPCTMQPRVCFLCSGTKQVTSTQDAEFAQKYFGRTT